MLAQLAYRLKVPGGGVEALVVPDAHELVAAVAPCSVTRHITAQHSRVSRPVSMPVWMWCSAADGNGSYVHAYITIVGI